MGAGDASAKWGFGEGDCVPISVWGSGMEARVCSARSHDMQREGTRNFSCDTSLMKRQRSQLGLHAWLILAMAFPFAGCGQPKEDEEQSREDDEDDEDEDAPEGHEPKLPKSESDGEEDEDDKKEDGEEDKDDKKEEKEKSPEPEPEKPKAKDNGPKEDICNETVPPKHYVDNIPAYSQCAESLNAKVWSNDGISTATSSKGDGWVPTQWGGGYQCTEFAKRYMYFRFGVEKFPNGNAGGWCEGVTPAGLEKNSEPVHGDLIIFGPGACGASVVTGHVGVVDKVDKDKEMVEFVEQNQANRRVCAISTAACFLHAKKNQ